MKMPSYQYIGIPLWRQDDLNLMIILSLMVYPILVKLYVYIETAPACYYFCGGLFLLLHYFVDSAHKVHEVHVPILAWSGVFGSNAACFPCAVVYQPRECLWPLTSDLWPYRLWASKSKLLLPIVVIYVFLCYSLSKFSGDHCVIMGQLLHMPWQHCCHGMCKICSWSG